MVASQQTSLPTTTTNRIDTRPNKVDVTKAFKMRYDQRCSYQQIADTMGVSKNAVWLALKPFRKLLAHKEQLHGFRGNEGTFYGALKYEIVKSLLDDKDGIKSQSAFYKAKMLESIDKVDRLEAGKATQNVSHAHFLDIGDSLLGLLSQDR